MEHVHDGVLSFIQCLSGGFVRVVTMTGGNEIYDIDGNDHYEGNGFGIARKF